VAICGNEGAAGLSGILGSTNSPYQNLVQVPGAGTRLAMEEARNEFSRCGAFQGVLLNYTNSLLLQVSQTALCNRIIPTRNASPAGCSSAKTALKRGNYLFPGTCWQRCWAETWLG
jgi:hypothetical protein